jgi:hypothetical protein
VGPTSKRSQSNSWLSWNVKEHRCLLNRDSSMFSHQAFGGPKPDYLSSLSFSVEGANPHIRFTLKKNLFSLEALSQRGTRGNPCLKNKNNPRRKAMLRTVKEELSPLPRAKRYSWILNHILLHLTYVREDRLVDFLAP